jgi:hypothetical protein
MQESTKSNNYQFVTIVKDDGTIIQQDLPAGMVVATAGSAQMTVSENKEEADAPVEAIIGQKSAFNDAVVEVDGAYEWGSDRVTFCVKARPSVAEPLSRALYKIINPDGDGLYARVYHHPDPERYSLLEFRETDVVPISIAADPSVLADALAITVTDGALTQEEVDAIVNGVAAAAGQVVNLVDFIPESWADMQMEKEKAIALGYDI